MDELERGYGDLTALLELGLEANDPASVQEVASQIPVVAEQFEKAEFSKLLSDENDLRNAIVTINAGAGGTESQDWAQMLYRMLERWAEAHGYRAQVLDVQPGEEAGIKSVI